MLIREDGETKDEKGFLVLLKRQVNILAKLCIFYED